jgi:hypothetical protein
MADMSDKMKATVQPHVPEPVIAVGVLQPAGTWGAMGGDQLSGIVGSLMRKNANKRSAGLGKNSAFRTKIALVAVTEGRVYAFNAKGWGPTCKIVDRVGDWDRSDLKITATKANLSTQFVIDVESTGQHFELETNALMGIGGFTSKFVEALKITTTSGDAGGKTDDTAGDTNGDAGDTA